MEELLLVLRTDIERLPYLFFGYTAIWVIILGYAYSLSRRENNLRDEIEEIRKAIEERKGK